MTPGEFQLEAGVIQGEIDGTLSVLDGSLEFGVPVINVAYGNASEEWAKSYGVDERLVYDPGSALVQPLGIGTFTTLVMDAEGNVIHRDYPRNPGYADRVRAALETLQ